MENKIRKRDNWESLIRVIPDFPKPGIQFIDWLPILNDMSAFKNMMRDLSELAKGFNFNKIAALEARGFLVGLPLAMQFEVGFVPIRKKGKLPGEIITQSYELEYGTDSMEIQTGMINSNDSVLIVDDLIATSGSILAANELVSKFTKNIQDLFVIELTEMKGTSKITCPYRSLIQM